MIRIVIHMYDILQNVNVDMGILCCKIFLHTSFQGVIEMFYHTCLQFYVCGEEVDVLLFQKTLKITIENFSSFISL